MSISPSEENPPTGTSFSILPSASAITVGVDQEFQFFCSGVDANNRVVPNASATYYMLNSQTREPDSSNASISGAGVVFWQH